MRTTVSLFAVMLALALVSTNAEARKHHRHHHHCVAPSAEHVRHLAIVGWASLFVGWPVNVWATRAADAAAKQVLACGRAGGGRGGEY